jgi:hypothetical protein
MTWAKNILRSHYFDALPTHPNLKHYFLQAGDAFQAALTLAQQRKHRQFECIRHALHGVKLDIALCAFKGAEVGAMQTTSGITAPKVPRVGHYQYCMHHPAKLSHCRDCMRLLRGVSGLK